jgi:hypothetical protein
MNFFKVKTRWSNAEFIVLKLALASAYIFIGTYFHEFFSQYYLPIIILFVITVIWSLYLWLNKMKNDK